MGAELDDAGLSGLPAQACVHPHTDRPPYDVEGRIGGTWGCGG